MGVETGGAEPLIRLHNFEGPLDLLLHLIEERQLEITEVSLVEVTDQYLAYVEAMRPFDLDIASEFLVVASRLLDLKARTLLPPPRPEPEEEEAADPGQELVRRLLEYRQFRQAAQLLKARGELEELRFPRTPEDLAALAEQIEVAPAALAELLAAMERVLAQAPETEAPELEMEAERLTVAEAMRQIVARLRERGGSTRFEALFPPGSGRLRIVVTFLALLELLRRRRVTVRQEVPFGPIEIAWAGGSLEAGPAGRGGVVDG
ncbi:MAG: segregation/condensation protein A [Thermaerobacter sp.]|nr:hypothetical protein [Bacillota bacterium]